MPLLDADAAAALPGTGVLLDVRAAVRYRGEHEPIDPVAGHVPGARNLPVTDLDGPDGLLLPAARLREVLAAAGVPDGATVGAYCGSGIAAARAVLALTRAGVADPALYVGSWSNWVADGDRPIAVGDGAVVTPESESADEVTR
jgi:thiosulfate/3-mercaptopyruvate sulfurtransferase